MTFAAPEPLVSPPGAPHPEPLPAAHAVGSEQPRRGRRIGLGVAIGVVAAVAVGVAVGGWITAVQAIGALSSDVGTQFGEASAEDGFEYVTGTYSVRFPGEPEESLVPIDGSSISLRTAVWQNLRSAYVVDHHPGLRGTGTVDDILEGTRQAVGGVIVESRPVAIEGGTAVFAEMEVDGRTLWMMFVLSDMREYFALTVEAAENDQAFFDSFHLL